jgi:uncharacterized protein (TIGR02600 family)
VNTDYLSLGNSTYRYAVTTTNPRGKISGGGTGTMEDQSAGPRNYVIPTKLSNDAIGMGRMVTISQVALVFMASKIENTTSGNFTIADYPFNTGNTTVLYNGTLTNGLQISDGETHVYKANPANSTSVFTPSLPAPFTEIVLPSPNGSVTGSPSIIAQKTLEVRSFLLFQPYLAAQGTPSVVPGLEVEIQGLDAFKLNGTPFVSSSPISMRSGSEYWSSGKATGTSDSLGSFQMFALYPTVRTGTMSFGGYPQMTYFKEAKSGGTDKDADYPFVSPSIPVNGATINFNGGPLTVILKSWKNGEEFQRLSVNFESASFVNPQHIRDGDTKFADGGVNTVTFPQNGSPSYLDGNMLSVRKRLLGNSNGGGNSGWVMRPGDVVCSMEWSPTDTASKGDFRLLALSPNASSFAKVNGYGSASNAYPGTVSSNVTPLVGRFAHSLRASSVSQYDNTEQYGWIKKGGAALDRLSTILTLGAATTLVPGVAFNSYSAPTVPAQLAGAVMANGALGDWQSGMGSNTDGGFFTRPDPGDSNKNYGGYFGDKYNIRVNAGDTYEPNRAVPSAGLFGGLITPDASGTLQPWQTLLFSPRPAGGAAHPGFGSPMDHLYLDNFWIPVVEPFPISETLSTAGKVNLNFQMMPFNHIERSTALRGALDPLMVSAIEDRLASTTKTYKNSQYTWPIQDKIRSGLDRDATISEFGKLFGTGAIYQSATQVSESSLVPQGQSASTLTTWWGSRRITSDTLREQPYTALLSRVTTKSNTFTVHYRVQALRQPPRPGRNWAEWDEARDQVVGEYRGSTTIERFLDPNAQNIPDYTQVNLSGNYDPIDKFYRWRVLSQKQFAP